MNSTSTTPASCFKLNKANARRFELMRYRGLWGRARSASRSRQSSRSASSIAVSRLPKQGVSSTFQVRLRLLPKQLRLSSVSKPTATILLVTSFPI
jgi:hypothetical protein